MIPLVNKQAHIKFHYSNTPLPQVPIRSAQNSIMTFNKGEGIRESQKKNYVIQSYSTLELQTKKKINSQKKINNTQFQSLNKVEKTVVSQIPQVYQSLHKAQQLDPVQNIQTRKGQLPVLKSEGPKNDASKFKFQVMEQVKESDFLKDANDDYKRKQTDKGNNGYDVNPSSNLYSRGEASKAGQKHHHGKRAEKVIKTFKIDAIQQKKESQFTGCCGFGITNKMAFLSKEK